MGLFDYGGLVAMVLVSGYVLCMGCGWVPRSRREPSNSLKGIGALMLLYYVGRLLALLFGGDR